MSACDACLRRTALVAALGAQLDVEWRRQSAPAAVLSLPDDALLRLDPTGRVAREHAGFDAGRAREASRGAGLVAVCRCDAAYPEPLRELADPPAVLHVAGSVAAPAAEGVAIVGARRGTPYGIEVARGLGRGLGAAGVPVISGLALGVDSAAHVGALAAAGPAPSAGAHSSSARPVAVLAGGADVPYPASRRRLYREIRERGAVVSEMPPGFTPYRWCFVARNRIIAGLAAATVVVEATERSGSLTTADFAANLGRPVGAVPGPVTSRFSSGTNGLLAAGAAVIRDVHDALDLVGAVDLVGSAGHAGPAGRVDRHRPAAPAIPLEPRLRRLLDAIERGGGSLAELATDPEATKQVLADLTDLELRGLVRRGFGGRYVRTAGEPW